MTAPQIVFTDAAIDDLRRVGPEIAARVMKKILLLEENPQAGYPLGSALTGFRKLVVGRNAWRVVYRVLAGTIEICEIWAVGARADAEVYSAAVARVRAAGDDLPELVLLREVVTRLGRLAGHVAVTRQAAREPVPDWLADRLIYTAGMARERVAALDLEQAVEAWADYRSAPR